MKKYREKTSCHRRKLDSNSISKKPLMNIIFYPILYKLTHFEVLGNCKIYNIYRWLLRKFDLSTITTDFSTFFKFTIEIDLTPMTKIVF